MGKTINARVINKHDSEANWKKAVNFIPLIAEIIVYDADSIHPQARLKIGDGKTSINDLPFYGEKKDLVWGDFTNNTINSSSIAWENF